MFKNIYNYRQLLKSNIKKEIRGKYKGSFLGILWSFLNPLLMACIYAIVFPFILKNTQEHYVTYIIIGIIPWNFFTTAIFQGTFCIVGNGSIIKKVYFPREILPLSIVISGAVNFLISLPIIIIFVLCSGLGLSHNLIYVPLVLLVQCLLQLGIVLITCSINVYIRDAEYIIQFLVNMLFYATPIIYDATLFPEKFRWILNLNPMTPIINGYRNIFYYHAHPNLTQLLFLLIICTILCFVGYKIFNKLEKGFAEEV